MSRSCGNMDLSRDRRFVCRELSIDRRESEGRSRCLEVVDAVDVRIEAECAPIEF